MNYKKFSLIVISGLLLVMLLTGITVYYIDPFFQYHKPNKNMSYVLDTNSFAYINPGIAKNFEYDTVITGSSMSRAIEPSYVNDVLGGKTVKLSMAEARGKDLSELFEVLEKQSNVKKIVMSLDTFAYSVDKDYSTYTYPLYLVFLYVTILSFFITSGVVEMTSTSRLVKTKESSAFSDLCSLITSSASEWNQKLYSV